MKRPTDIEVDIMQVEFAQLRKGAGIMARHILSQPAAGADAISEVRRVANDVMAAESIAAAHQSRGPA